MFPFLVPPLQKHPYSVRSLHPYSLFLFFLFIRLIHCHGQVITLSGLFDYSTHQLFNSSALQLFSSSALLPVIIIHPSPKHIKMQFKTLLAAAAALSVVNAVEFTNSVWNNVTAGESFTLTWSGASGPVTILLKNGPATNLQTVSTVASGLSGTSYTYSVPSSLPADTYAFEIDDSTATPNYSSQFQLLGATVTTSASASVSTSSIASSASSVISSISSVASSLTASIGNSTSSASVSSASNASKSTSVSASASKTSGSTTSASKTASSTSTSTGSAVPNSLAASDFSSPLALVFLTVAAIFTLN